MLGRAGLDVFGLGVDIASEQETQALAEQVFKRFGAIDGLINIARS